MIIEANEYQRAANYLSEYFASLDPKTITPSEEIISALNTFQNKFSPEILASLSDDALLSTIFGGTNSLCYWLERQKECRTFFGSIAGGSAYKFVLFKKSDTGIWNTGSSLKPVELSDEYALTLGKSIRDILVKGSALIDQAVLDSVDAYKQLDEKLQSLLGEKYYNLCWVHKYFSMIHSDKLSGFHIDKWQYHVLRALGIKPDKQFYVRSGQIAMIQNRANLYYYQFYELIHKRFGDPISFLRLGSTGGNNEKYADRWAQKGIVGIGWNKVGSLSDYPNSTNEARNALKEKLKELYFPNDNGTASRKATELLRFYESDQNTVFVVMDGETLVSMANNPGAYYLDESSDLGHTKPATWKKVFEGNEKLPERSEGKLTSCYPFKNEDNLMFLYRKYFFSGSSDPFNTENDNESLSSPAKEKTKMTDIKLNTILYGPPGTGKTYNSVNYAVAICEGKALKDVEQEEYNDVLKRFNELKAAGRIAFTTFHQSYGYEEFIEGIKPITDSNNAISYKTVSGVFKEFCENAESFIHSSTDSDTLSAMFEDAWGKLSLAAKSNGNKYTFTRGTGSSIDTVFNGSDSFKVSWSGGTSNILVKNAILDQWKAKSISVEEIPNGGKRWTFFANQAVINELKKYGLPDIYSINTFLPCVFIIDEINRGNISKIFGELITLIEVTKRKGCPEGMTAKLPYSHTAFSVPKNVYILGTMNTADRSIALMDTALRRRFDFVEKMPNPRLLDDVIVRENGYALNVSELLETINNRIEYLFDREHTIGHAFFMGLKNGNATVKTLSEVFKKNIIPLLQEYFYEDYEKIQLVLGDNDKTNPEFKFIYDKEADANEIFKGSPDLDIKEKIFRINEPAFNHIESYIEIIQ